MEAANSVGLQFNINNIKRAAIRYYADHNMVVHDTDGTQSSIRISRSNVTTTAALQAMLQLLIENTMKYINNDKYGFKEITYPSVLFSMKEEPSLWAYFENHMHRFDSNMSYDECPFLDKELNAFAEQLNKDYILDVTSRRLIKYLLTTFFYQILSISYQFVLYSKKQTTPITMTVYVINTMVTGETQRYITDFVQTVAKSWVDNHVKDGEDDEEVAATPVEEIAEEPVEEEPEESEEEEPVKPTPKKLKKVESVEEPVKKTKKAEPEPIEEPAKKSAVEPESTPKKLKKTVAEPEPKKDTAKPKVKKMNA